MDITAEEVLKSKFSKPYEYYWLHKSITDAMIEFAKLHVDAALEAVSKNAKVKTKTTSGGLLVTKYVIDKISVLNSYPLENIK